MKSTEDMLRVNRTQAAYYDSIHEAQADTGIGGYARTRKAGLLTRVWAHARLKQQQAVAAAGVAKRKIDAHEAWLARKRGGGFWKWAAFPAASSRHGWRRPPVIMWVWN